MPFVRIWVHLIWTVKNREPLLTPSVKQKIINHIKVNCKEKEIWLDSINGSFDHLHTLISLNKEQSISKVAMLIKGESSHWINKNNIITGKFEWQTEYAAFSVSESNVGKVRKYIDNQEEHHRSKSFKEEYDKSICDSGES